MPEYTDLSCNSPLSAQLVLDYLNREVANVQENEPDAPHITGEVVKSTVRIIYHDLERWSKERREWDVQLMGFRDGVEQVLSTAKPQRRSKKQKIEDQLRDSDVAAQLSERDNIVYGHYDALPQCGEHVARIGKPVAGGRAGNDHS